MVNARVGSGRAHSGIQSHRCCLCGCRTRVCHTGNQSYARVQSTHANGLDAGRLVTNHAVRDRKAGCSVNKGEKSTPEARQHCKHLEDFSPAMHTATKPLSNGRRMSTSNVVRHTGHRFQFSLETHRILSRKKVLQECQLTQRIMV